MSRLIALIVAAGMVACSGPEPVAPGSGCVPNRVEACPCPGGPSGTQTCLPDRTFGACVCADAGVVCVCVVEGTAPEAREAARLGVGADGFVLVRGAATALDEGATLVSFDPERVESEAARLAELLESRGIFDAR